MTELTPSTLTILFLAISLIMIFYTTVRFRSCARMVYDLKTDSDKNPSAITRPQLTNLHRRLRMTRWMQLFGASSLLLCMVCAFLICIEEPETATFILGITLILLVISIGISVRELLISIKALEIHLDTIERMKTLTATTGREGDIETSHRNISASRKSHGNRGNDGASGEPAKEQSSEKSALASGSDHKRNSQKTVQKQNPEKSAEQPSENTGKRRRSSKKNTDKVTPASSDAPHLTDTTSEVPKAEGSTTTTRNRSRGGRRRGGRGHGTTSADTSSETRTNTGGDSTHATTLAQVPASPEAKA